jgi:hypothetical protein
MLRFRRILLATATLVAGAAFSASPAAAYPRPLGYPEQIQTQHFLVHYTGDGIDHVLHQQAADLAALAENAYSTETGWGFPAPASDGDGLIDVYAVAQPPGVLGSAWPDDESSLTTTTGWIELDPARVEDQHAIAHELFHLIQFGLWIPNDSWLAEATAEYAAFRAEDFPLDAPVGPYDMALDCLDKSYPDGIRCSRDLYEGQSYSRWPFFEYLTERYGSTFVKDIYASGGASGSQATPAVTALSNAVGAKGGSLADVFTDWTVAVMTGSYTALGLKDTAPTPDASILTGTIASLNAKLPKGSPLVTSGPITPLKLSVNHLAVRYVALQRGDGATTGACYAATLTVNVALPSGSSSRPYFWWSEKDKLGKSVAAAQALNVSGSTASIALPWDTCNWGSTLGYLSLPNSSSTADAQEFNVSGTISIDRSTIATPTLPPDPVKMPGVVVAAPTADEVPTIDLYGPELIRLSPADRQLRLIVSASGPGKLQAAIGSYALGSASLRAGNNDVRFSLPSSALRSLRRTAALGNVLTLTPLSPKGVAGEALLRPLAVDKTKAKAKTKQKAKKSKPKKR